MGARGLSPLRALAGLCLIAAVGCGGGGGSADGGPAGDAGPLDASSDGAADGSGEEPPRELGGDRPARIVVPPSYDSATPTPLLVLLHGFTADATAQNAYFGGSAAAREHGFLLLLPNGTENRDGERFWNATDACCDFYGSGVDDVGYLRGLIAEAKEHYNVDAGRVYLLGHSNGGYMAYRMACDASEDITAIASLAGATFKDEMRCDPARPVSVLQMHGDADGTVAYEGNAAHPGAVESVERFAGRAGCDTAMTTDGEPFDFDTSVDGDETEVVRYETGCEPGLDAELWTIVGGGHIPPLADGVIERIFGWLGEHDRASP